MVVILAMAMVAALAPAGLAKKPPGTPGGKSPFSVTVDVVGIHELETPYTWEDGALGYPFYWVNAVGDQMKLVVTVDGPTTGTVTFSGTEVTGSLVNPVEFIYTATDADLASEGVNLVVEVSADGKTKTVSTIVAVEPYPDCEALPSGLEYDSEESATEITHIYEGTPSEWCRWTPVMLGTWDVELTPATPITRPTQIGATLRDHVPGNWCALSDENRAGEFLDNSGVVDGRTKGEPVTGFFHLPDSGICLGGGAGGYTMAVGTTTDFVLATDEHIKITKVVSKVIDG
ncbi:MAG: hypothetical protein JSV07_08520 [Acidimicrobiia bacterium]|nr:MAG: hypothetical protein JSV07_08520 [Acidimicrobiia bacterium]